MGIQRGGILMGVPDCRQLSYPQAASLASAAWTVSTPTWPVRFSTKW